MAPRLVHSNPASSHMQFMTSMDFSMGKNDLVFLFEATFPISRENFEENLAYGLQIK
jgi:hypothetical protein